MEEKSQTESYHGHKLEVTAQEVRRGVWSWGYLIDGKVTGNSRSGAALPDAEAARRRGMLDARARSDELGGKK